MPAENTGSFTKTEVRNSVQRLFSTLNDDLPESISEVQEFFNQQIIALSDESINGMAIVMSSIKHPLLSKIEEWLACSKDIHNCHISGMQRPGIGSSIERFAPILRSLGSEILPPLLYRYLKRIRPNPKPAINE
jgi:hypothetical protein